MARSNIMGLHALKNSPKVNHFDQSYRHCFSAKSGEILPVYYNMLFPGDKIKVNASSLTKTTPLNTYAFTRLRENIQFFAVRLSSLWRFFPEIYKNMPTDLYGNSTSRIAQDSLSQVVLSTSLPYFNNIDLRNAVASLYKECSNLTGGRSEAWNASKVYQAISQSENPDSPYRDPDNYMKNSVTGYLNNAYSHNINLRINASDNDPAVLTSGWNFANLRNGVLRYQSASKLLSMLGYGDFSQYYTDDFNDNNLSAQIPSSSVNSQGLSVFPLLAYHKICQDHYKYRQWQSYIPQICNIDYVTPMSSMNLSHIISEQVAESLENADGEPFDLDSPTILDLEFSNLPLDYLNGVLPNSQYGDMSVAPLINVPTSIDRVSSVDGSDLNVQGDDSINAGIPGPHSSSSLVLSSDYVKPVKLTSNSVTGDPGLRIDALRKSLQLQRYKEIQMSSDTSYQDLIEKHFGVRPKNIAPFNSQYIGGYDTNFDINPQVNQNLSGENTATFGAAPLASGNGTISYICEDEPVIILGLYTCVPQMDYENVGFDRRLLLTDATDFPIPEMDSIGMQTTYLSEVYTPNESAKALSSVDVKRTYGYAPRYAEWKTARDLVSGCFSTPAFRHWTNPFPKDYLRSIFYNVGSEVFSSLPTSIPAFLFKNSPWWLSRVFANERMLSVTDDFLLVGAFFKVDVTRRLSKYGLPYAS